MIKSLVLGTVLGGLAALVWSSFSWEVLGWHEKTMVSFQNEDEVSAVIASHATKDGTYILPAAHPSEGLNSDQKKEMQAALVAKMQKGPIMVAAVRRGGFGSSSQALVTQLLSLICGIPAHLAVASNERTELHEKGGVSRGRRARGKCYRRSSQLELVGLLWRIHGSESCRFHGYLAARGPRHREGRQA